MGKNINLNIDKQLNLQKLIQLKIYRGKKSVGQNKTFISLKKNNKENLIDLEQNLFLWKRVTHLLKNLILTNKFSYILWIGTRSWHTHLLKEAASLTNGAFSRESWRGGSLTNLRKKLTLPSVIILFGYHEVILREAYIMGIPVIVFHNINMNATGILSIITNLSLKQIYFYCNTLIKIINYYKILKKYKTNQKIKKNEL